MDSDGKAACKAEVLETHATTATLKLQPSAFTSLSIALPLLFALPKISTHHKQQRLPTWP
jgi:hypothetical protein